MTMVNVDVLIDPEVAQALQSMPTLGTFTFEQLPAIRAQRAAQLALIQLSNEVERTDHTVPGVDGAPDVTIRVHRPKGVAGALPAIYWMHGGGYMLGSYDAEDLRFDKWCTSLNCVGVSVEYRLAPETPYPGPLEDCYAGYKWVHSNAARLGIDPARLGIGGASAGGGLAAGLALLARDRGQVPVAFQLLVYPMIDDRRVTASSKWETVPIWPPSANERGWAAYLGPAAGGDIPFYAAPTRATELRGLPPALIVVGALDGFLDEDVEYAMRLTHAEVPTELHVYPGGPHGFDSITPGAALAKRARNTMEDWLARVMR
jgi:acetyl esterase/lipase